MVCPAPCHLPLPSICPTLFVTPPHTASLLFLKLAKLSPASGPLRKLFSLLARCPLPVHLVNHHHPSNPWIGHQPSNPWLRGTSTVHPGDKALSCCHLLSRMTVGSVSGGGAGSWTWLSWESAPAHGRCSINLYRSSTEAATSWRPLTALGPGCVLRVRGAVSQVNPLNDGACNRPHSTDEETEAQGGKAARLTSLSRASSRGAGTCWGSRTGTHPVVPPTFAALPACTCLAQGSSRCGQQEAAERLGLIPLSSQSRPEPGLCPPLAEDQDGLSFGTSKTRGDVLLF